MASNVMRNWEQLLNQRIDLIQFAIDQGNSPIIAGAFAQDSSSLTDWMATFLDQANALGGNNRQILKELEDQVLKTNDQMRDETKSIQQKMSQQAQKPEPEQDQQQWEDLLSQSVDQLNHTGTQHLDQLKDFAKQRIGKIDGRVQRSATQIFTAAFTAVYSFNINAVTWLQVAEDSASLWYRQPRVKAEEFEDITERYYEGSKQTIKGWFDTRLGNSSPLSHSRRHRHRRHHNNGGNNLEAIKDIASKLQCMGLDSFTIVRKGDSWALEIDSPA